jgi:dolichol-phosphate mannosyltransferase
MKTNTFLFGLGLAQAAFGLRVALRLLSTAQGVRLPAVTEHEQSATGTLSVIVPVLNEYRRLAPCLEGLLASGEEVSEILVVDGGSCDGTQALVRYYQQQDPRIRLLDAQPIPSGWNGKAWGLQVGLQHAALTSSWILTLDADVRPSPQLTRSLLAYAQRTSLAALSLATQQDIEGTGQGLLHPALLTTLVYRFGIPGHATRKISAVQANGQCFLVQREILEACGGFELGQDSLCEDITIARALAAAGHQVGFYEAEELVSVRMYEDWRETWQNWPRSLPMHDRFSGWHTLLGWLEIALVQALPLPLFLVLSLLRSRNRPVLRLLLLNGIFVAMRFGVLCGTARAYRHLPWSYWLSPVCDLPVVLKLGTSVLQRRHSWRGRVIIRGEKMSGTPA